MQHYIKLILLISLLLFASCSTSGKNKLSHEEKARMWVDVANGALIEGDPIGALQNLARAEEEGVDLPDIHHSRALAFYMRKDPENALTSAKKAVALQPKYSAANNTLGKLLLDRGAFEEALPPLTAAASDPLYRDSYRASTNLGILFYRQGKYELARKHFDEAINSSPILSCIARYYRGHVSLRESKMKDAIQDYEQATQKLCADFADAHFALGIAYQRDRKYQQARRKFLEVQDRFPKTPLADQSFLRLREIP